MQTIVREVRFLKNTVYKGIDPMSLKPDYGLRKMKDGISCDVNLYFHDFRLFSLTVLGEGQYSTMVEVPLDGELHALSLDFNQNQLEQILSKASPHIASFIHKELSREPSTPRMIDFEGEIIFGVRARLGQLQQGQYESFVPLVAQEIMNIDQTVALEMQSISTNELKKGTRVRLRNGWEAILLQKCNGNIVNAQVFGDFTETGSIYTHTIIAAKINGQWVNVEMP